MVRNINIPPKLCRRKNNDTAYTTFNGKRYYLGKWGADSTIAKYNAILADWRLSRKKPVNIVEDRNYRLEELLGAFMEDYLAKPVKSDLNAYKLVIDALRLYFPYKLADDFRPTDLETLRTYFSAKQERANGQTYYRSRTYINKLIGYVRSIFSWGVGKSIVRFETYQALRFVRPLRKGSTNVPETRKRTVVSDHDLKGVMEYLQPIYRDIIQLLRITGMRPKELCSLRIRDLDRSGDIWIYHPKNHKTEWKGKDRVIAFGERSQSVLKRHLTGRKPTEYIFSPKRVMTERWQIQAQNRKSKVSPYQQARAEWRKPKKYARFSPSLETNTIANRLREACKRALSDKKISRAWTLYELRHTAITEVRLKAGVESAQHFAGHSTIATQDYYDHSATIAVIELAKKMG